MKSESAKIHRFPVAPIELEREFKFFNCLEGGVCTTCAPGDQEKSIEWPLFRLK